MFSHARGYICWTTHALVQARTTFWTHWLWHQTWVWCSRLHESTNLTINSQVMLWNGVIACMKAPVLHNMYSRAGDNTFFNIEYAKHLGTTGCHPRERQHIYIYIYIYICVYICIYIYIYMYMYTHAYYYIHTHMYMYVICVHVMFIIIIIIITIIIIIMSSSNVKVRRDVAANNCPWRYAASSPLRLEVCLLSAWVQVRGN